MSKESIQLQKLSPDTDIDISVYEDALKKAFEDKSLLNIAITGSNGAGKSSVINTYLSKRAAEKNVIRVSFAKFKNALDSSDDDRTRGKEETKSVQCSEVGGSKQSTDKTKGCKDDLSSKVINQLVHQIDSKKIPATRFPINKYSKKKSIIMIILVALWLGAGLSTVFVNTKMQNIEPLWIAKNSAIIFCVFIACTVAMACIIVSNLLRGNVSKISIKGNEISLFDDHDSTFDKYLSEVKYLFDNCGCDAVLFEDIDRFEDVEIFERLREINILVNSNKEKNDKHIKFIYLMRDDLLEPKERVKFFDVIIPILPCANANNAYGHFSKMLKGEGINDSLLFSISQYIDDMRLIKNIVNEFHIYNQKLSNANKNVDELFASIVYKNLFPQDYNLLISNQGFIHDVFDYNNPTCPKYRFIQDVNNNQNSKELISKAVWQPLYEFIYEHIKYNNLKEKIENYNSVKGPYSNVLVFFIEKGLINEHCLDYTSNFVEHEGFTRNDNIFFKRVLDKVDDNSGLKLDNCNALFERIDEIFYKYPCILNYAYLDFLVENYPENQKTKDTLSQIKAKQDVSFVKNWYESSSNKLDLVKAINSIWPEAVNLIIEGGQDKVFIDKYTLDYLRVVPSDQLKQTEFARTLSKYIVENKKYFDRDIENINDIIPKLKYLPECKVKKLDCGGKYKDNYKAICNEELYEYSLSNVVDVLEHIISISEAEFMKKPISTVLGIKGGINNIVSQNINQFLEDISEWYDQFYDDENDVIDILNNNSIDKSNKLSYLSKYKNNFHNFTCINDHSIWCDLLEKNLITMSAENAIEYYKNIGQIDEALEHSINDNDIQYNVDDIGALDCADVLDEFIEAVLHSDDINKDHKIKIIKDCRYICADYDVYKKLGWKAEGELLMQDLIAGEIVSRVFADVVEHADLDYVKQLIASNKLLNCYDVAFNQKKRATIPYSESDYTIMKLFKKRGWVTSAKHKGNLIKLIRIPENCTNWEK